MECGELESVGSWKKHNRYFEVNIGDTPGCVQPIGIIWYQTDLFIIYPQGTTLKTRCFTMLHSQLQMGIQAKQNTLLGPETTETIVYICDVFCELGTAVIVHDLHRRDFSVPVQPIKLSQAKTTLYKYKGHDM